MEVQVMTDTVQILWFSAGKDCKSRRVVDFVYSSKLGLSDIDFHIVTAQGWKAMKCPSPDAVARVEVQPQTTVAELEEVVRTIKTKGGYETIEIVARK
jgi:hypothetical protein